MALLDNKRKKGSTGKTYTQDKKTGTITVKYSSDGSQRTVRPSDSSYAATKSAMEKDIKSYKSGDEKKKTKVNATNATGVNYTKKSQQLPGTITSSQSAKMKQNLEKRGIDSRTTGQKKVDLTQKPSAKVKPIKTTDSLAKSIDREANQKLNQKIKDSHDVAKGFVRGAADINTALPNIKQGIASNARLLTKVEQDKILNDQRQRSRLNLSDAELQKQWLDYNAQMDKKQMALAAENDRLRRLNDARYGSMYTGLAGDVRDMTGSLSSTMLPAAAMSLIPGAGPVASIGTMYAGAAGAGFNQAINDGATIEQANNYAPLAGAAEIIPEVMTAGVPLIPGIAKIGGAVGKKAGTQLGKRVLGTAVDIAGEGGEEALSEILGTLAEKQTYNPDAQIDWGNVLQAAKLGAMSAGAMNAPVFAANVRGDIRNLSQDEMARQAELLNKQNQKYATALHGNLPTASEQAERQAQLAQESKKANENRRNINNITPKIEKFSDKQAREAQNQQNIPQNNGMPPQNAQNEPQQANTNTATNVSGNMQNAPQNQTSEADFQQNQQNAPANGNISTNSEGFSVITRRTPTEEEMRMVTPNYQASTDNALLQFISDVKSKVSSKVTRFFLNGPTQNEVSDIKAITGVDVSGYRRVIDSGAVEHIEKRHGINGKADRSMADDNDLARIQFVLDDYDSIEGIANKSSYAVNSDGSPAKMVKYTKRVNGSYFVVEAAPDNKNKTLRIVSAYKNTAPTNVVRADNSVDLAITPETPHSSDAVSTTSIPQAEDVGNSIPRESLSPEDRSYIERLEARSGMKFNVVDRLTNEEANGEYDNGVITLTEDLLNNPDDMRKTSFHELVHPMRGTDYHKELIDWAVDYYRAKHGYKNKDAVMMAVSEAYKAQDPERTERYDLNTDAGYENVEDEVAAIFIGDLVKDENVARKLCEEKPSLAERILEWLQDFVNRFTNRQMSEQEKVIMDTTKKAIRSFQNGLDYIRENGGYSSDAFSSEMLSVKPKITPRERQIFEQRVHTIVNGNRNARNNSDMLYLGMTPGVLKKIGFPDLPILMTPNHVYSSANTSGRLAMNYHGLGEDLIKSLPDLIANPVMIIESESRSDSIIVVTDKLDSKKNNIVIPLMFDGEGLHLQNVIDANIATSAYGKSGIKDITDYDRILLIDKKRSSSIEHVQRLLLSNNVSMMNFDDNVTRFRQRVKDYYRNKILPVPSKVRDKEYGTALADIVDGNTWEKMFESTNGKMYNIKALDMGELANIEKDLTNKYNKSEEEVKTVVGHMKSLRDYMEQLGNEKNTSGNRLFPYLYQWNNKEVLRYSNGQPVMTWIKKNGEYDMNVEASLVCIKKEPMNRVLQYMLDEGIFDISNLQSTDYAVITRILNKHGLRVPCGACFVENRRENTGPDMFRKMASEFNELVDAANIVDGKVDEASLKAKMKEMAARKTSGEDGTAEGTTKRYAKFIMDNPGRVRKISASEFMTPDGALTLKRDMPAIYSIATSRYGAGTAKPVEPKTPYTGEVRRKKPTKAGKWGTKGALKVGGVRNQSFSDDEASLFLDQCQKYLDFSLNQLPAQEYTKVPYHAKMFGLTGAKMNLSMFPEAQISSEDRAYLSKLTREQKEKDPVFLRAQENAGLDENGEFLWNPESFGWDNAVELCEDPRYSGNVAPNAVGVSDKQIWKLFDNKYIGQVIPYHKSGQNNDVAAMRNTDLFKDYSNYQNDMLEEGDSRRLPGESDLMFYRRVGQKSSYGKKIPKNGKLKFNFYDDLAKTEDPVQTSKNFIEACKKQGIIPRFPQFIYKPDGTFNENYWKCITDYPLMDINGKYKPMEPVQFDEKHLPEDWKGILRGALEEEQKLYDDIAEKSDAVAREAAAEIRGKFNQGEINIENPIGFNQVERRANNASYNIKDTDFIGDADRYNSMVDEYGSMEQGENPFGNNRDIQVPQQTSDFDRTRRFTRTAMEAEQVSDETVQNLKNEMTDDYGTSRLTYEPTSNESTLAEANRQIEREGWEKVSDTFISNVRNGQKIDRIGIATAERCIQEAQKAGDYRTAADLIGSLATVGTEYGQAIQALSMLKRLTPEGQLMAFKTSADRINNQIMKKNPNYTDAELVKITPEMEREFLEARSNAKRNEIMNKAIEEAAQNSTGTWVEKIGALRYANMLSNFRTHVRNMTGNVVMHLAYYPRNAISAALQDINALRNKKLYPKGMEQTHSWKNKSESSRAEIKDFVRADFESNGKIALESSGSRYNDSPMGQYEQNKRIFKNKALEAYAGHGKYSVSSALEAEDMLFKKWMYKEALADYMKANGISVQDAKNGTVKPNGASIAKGREYALEQAKKATFTEENRAASAISKFENTNVATKVFVGGLFPFKKTPMNIVTRGVEFSPAGIAMTGFKLVNAMKNRQLIAEGKPPIKTKSGYTYDINDAFDSFAANLTGTSIMVLGYVLASKGFLSGAGDDDEDKRAAKFDSQMGDQNFAIVNPETGESWTIDWLAPAAMPLFAGVELYKQFHAETDDSKPGYNAVLDSIGKISDPVFEMSCMQGVASALASYGGDSSAIASKVGGNIISSYGGQFTPAIATAVKKGYDDNVYSTYAPTDSGAPLGKAGEQFLRQRAAAMPGGTKLAKYVDDRMFGGSGRATLQPSIDVHGEERKRESAGPGALNTAKRLGNSLLNPTTYSSNKRTEIDNKLENLYRETGDSGVLPTQQKKNFDVTINGEKKTYYMSPLEYSRFATSAGKDSTKWAQDVLDNHSDLTPSEQSDTIKSLYTLSAYKAKKEMLKSRGIEYSDSQYERALEYEGGPASYYAAKTGAFAGTSYSVSQVDDFKAKAKDIGISDEAYMEIHSNVSGKDIEKETKVSYLDGMRASGTLNTEQYWKIYLNDVSSSADSITQCGKELGRNSELFQQYKKEYNATHKKQVH